MKTIPATHIQCVQYEISENKLSMLIYLNQATFRDIPLPEIASSIGPYKVRTVVNHATTQTVKIFFYPPDLRVSLEAAELHTELTRISENEDYAYFPA